MGLVQSNHLTAPHHKFSSQLYNVIASNNKQSNIVVSPMSIYLALLMATSGANGNTLSELVKGLAIDQVPPSIEAWRHIVASESLTTEFFTKLNKNILNIANNAFVDKSAKLDVQYTEHVKKAFLVDVTQCDFRGNSAGETTTINEWVANHTNQNIKDLIQPGILSASTRLVLVNAVHFLGQWKNAFDKESTYNSTFYCSDGTQVDCKAMSKTDVKEQYGADQLYHWVTLPFSDTKYKMTIVTAKDPSHLNALDGYVTEQLTHGVSGFPTQEVKLTSLSFPRFELEHGLDLSEILQGTPFNMRLPFTDDADFSSLLSGTEKVFIDKVIHKATIKVDEAGAEASAATAIVFRELSYNPNAISFDCRTPFAFILSDESSKSILFVGKVNKL